MRCYQRYEFQSQMQGFCMLILRDSIAVEGEAKIVEWQALQARVMTRTFMHLLLGGPQIAAGKICKMCPQLPCFASSKDQDS